MEKEILGVAQILEQHPMLSEKKFYKEKYLMILEYFVRQNSSDDIFSKALLQVYQEAFGIGDNYLYNGKNISKNIFRITSKVFRALPYQYALLLDCFFINSFFNEEKAESILNEMKIILKPRYHKKIDRVFGMLYRENTMLKSPKIEKQIDFLRKNKEFFSQKIQTVLIVANMSAGKSTLINALIGKKINKTQNNACTAKIHYIFNKPYEDGFSSEWDSILKLNANKSVLMTDDVNNCSSEISVGTYFRSMFISDTRMCLIDSPGVNSSINKDHMKLTHHEIETGDYGKLIYVLNGQNIGTQDDRNFLEYIYNHAVNEKIVFVVNKLDCYISGEDSIEETVAKVRMDLTGIGFKNPVICPVSAYAALLAKKYLYDEVLNEHELVKLQIFICKFNCPEYNLSKFYPQEMSDTSGLQLLLKQSKELTQKCCDLLLQSGLFCLENMITINE